MNGVDARATPVAGGYWGEFRKVHRTAWEPVRAKGRPKIFPTAAAAEVAAWRALRSHLCSDIVGTGEKAVAAKQAADAIFRKGRRIAVERR